MVIHRVPWHTAGHSMGSSLYRPPAGLHVIKGWKSHPALATTQVDDMQVNPQNQDGWENACNPCTDAGDQQSDAVWRHCLVRTLMSSAHGGGECVARQNLSRQGYTSQMVLYYSCILYRKKDSIFVHQNGF